MPLVLVESGVVAGIVGLSVLPGACSYGERKTGKEEERRQKERQLAR